MTIEYSLNPIYRSVLRTLETVRVRPEGRLVKFRIRVRARL